MNNYDEEIYDEENISIEDDINENDSVKTDINENDINDNININHKNGIFNNTIVENTIVENTIVENTIVENTIVENGNIDKIISDINYLIADDCNITRKFHKHILNLCKYSNINFIEAINGFEVIKLILMYDINYFNAIFIDNTMPKLTGCNTTLILRLLNYNKIIIAITGDNNINIINNFYKNGADYVLIKPIILDDINLLINLLVKNNYTRQLNRNYVYKQIVKNNGIYSWG